MNYFSIFSVLYMTSFLLEMTEKWKHPGFTSFFVVLITLLVFNKIKRWTFLLFLVTSTAYILLFRFPEVANHVNFIVLINVSLMIGLLYSWQQPGSTGETYFQMMLPFLRFSLVLVYFIAGFHKLNHDFFHPDVSCAGGLLLFGFVPILTSKSLGIPSVLILMTSLIILVRKLWGNPLRSLSRRMQTVLLALATCAVVSGGGVLFLLLAQERTPAGLKAVVVLSLASVVIAWELIGGLLLLVPRYQGPILLFSWMMHASLAIIGFVDFGTLAFALLFTFIPPTYLDCLAQQAHVKIGSYQVHRIYAYFGILCLCSFLALIHYRLVGIGDIKLLNGLLFNGGAVLLVWPILQQLRSPQRLPWSGVPLWTPQTPTFISTFILLMFLYGMTPYLGLRTAGNFSMFSNLRTEGPVSNHLLLSRNPLKIWGYQEDVVKFLKIDDEAADIGHKYLPLQGQQLPVVEFKKLIHKWTQAGFVVPLTFEYQGQIYTTPNVVSDPIWQTPKQSWEMVLMDFRIIQAEGPNQCRW